MSSTKTETPLNPFKIHRLSESQYQQAKSDGELEPNALYFTDETDPSIAGDIIYQEELTSAKSLLQIDNLDLLKDGGHYTFEFISYTSNANEVQILINNLTDGYYQTSRRVYSTTQTSADITPAGYYAQKTNKIDGWMMTNQNYPAITKGDIYITKNSLNEYKVSYQIFHSNQIQDNHSTVDVCGVMSQNFDNLTSLTFKLRTSGNYTAGTRLTIRKANFPVIIQTASQATDSDNSSNYFDVYSTEEVRTNKIWKDGKPIYRKVISTTLTLANVTTVTGVTVPHGILNVGDLVSLTMTRSKTLFPFMAFSQGHTVPTGIDDVNINIRYINDSWTSAPFTFTLEYTKTTDSAVLDDSTENPQVYVNNLIPYSTEETRIGTWTDGKPLYQKTIHFTSIGTLDVSSLSLDTVSFAECMVQEIASNGSGWRNVPWIYTESNGNYGPANWAGGFYIRSGHVYFQMGSSLSSIQKGHMTLRYTKTTDSVSSADAILNGLHCALNYSESETVIGTWFGKTHYMKTYKITSALSPGVEKEIGTLPTGISEVTDINVRPILTSARTGYYNDYYTISNTTVSHKPVLVRYEISTRKIFAVAKDENWTNPVIYITFTYTKNI